MPRRLIAIALVVVALVGGYAAFGTYALPGLVRGAVVDGLKDNFGADASLGEVRFHPIELRLVAHDFEVRDAEGAPALGFGTLDVDFTLASVWRRAWAFDAIRLEQPVAHLVRLPDGGTNLARLFASREPAPAEASAAAELPRVHVGVLELAGGRVEFEDRARAVPFAAVLAPISFRLDDFRSEGSRNAFRLEAAADSGARFEFEGAVAAAPLGSRGSLSIAALPARQIAAYLGELLPISLQEGTIGLESRYDVTLAEDGLRGSIDVPAVEVRGLATLGPRQEVPWQIASVAVRDSRVELAGRSVGVGSVEVAGARLPLWRSAAGLELPGLRAAPAVPPPAGSGAPPATAPTNEPPARTAAEAPEPPAWRVEVGRVSLRDITLPFEDRTLTPAAALDVVVEELTVDGLSWPLDGPLDVAARIASGAGGTIGARGKVEPAPLAADLDIDLESLSLAPARPYIARGSDLLLDAGSLGGALKIGLGPGAARPLSVAGNLQLDGLRSRDRLLQEDFARWRALEIRGIDYRSSPASLSIREIVAREPWIRLVIGANGVTNIEAVLDPAAAAARAERIAAERAAERHGKMTGSRQEPTADAGRGRAAQAAAAQAPRMRMRIDRVRIADGATHFADFTVRPNFAIAAEQLSGTITGLSSDPAARARVEIAGKVDRYAPVTVEGEVNYLSAHSFTDLTARFDNIELSTFNPYSGKFAGYAIDKGKLSVRTRYRVENRRLDAEHDIRIDQLELGGKVDSPDAVSLPLRLAIALLKDRDGVIDLELPVSGSIDDPSFRIGPIVWKMVVNLIGKIVTAPFALIGSLFGGGEELSFIDFAPGSAAVDPATGAKLESLRKGLVGRPALRIDVPAAADPAVDRRALEAQRFDAALAAGAADEVWRSDRKAYRDRLASIYREKLGARPDIPKPPPPAEDEAAPDPVEHAIAWLEAALRPSFAVPDEALKELAYARAAAVQDALLGDGQVDPSRVFVVTGAAKPADGAVRVELSLK